MRARSLKSVVSLVLIFTSLVTWAAPSFALRQSGVDAPQKRRQLTQALQSPSPGPVRNGGVFPGGNQVALPRAAAGLEEQIGSFPSQHEVLSDFTKRFLSGRVPSGHAEQLLALAHIPHAQLATQWIGVDAIAKGFVGSGKGLDSVARRQKVDEADLRAQDVQGFVAHRGGLLLDHINFETKGLTPGGLQAGAKTGDPHGVRTPTVSDVIEHTTNFIEGKPGASSIQMDGPGVETFGSFPDEVRALMVVTHIQPNLEAAVLKNYRVDSIEKLLDPELEVGQLVHRVADLNGVSISYLDVTILTTDNSDIDQLKSLQGTYSQMRFERLTGGTVQPAKAANLGVNDGRVRLFLRRSGITEAVYNTVFAGLYSLDGSISIFRPVSEQVKTGFDQRYIWSVAVLDEMRILRPNDWEAVRDGKAIFSSRQVKEPVVGAYTFLTDGRTDQQLPFNIPGTKEIAAGTYRVHTLVFSSNPYQDGAGYLWLSSDTYPYVPAGQVQPVTLDAFPSIPEFLRHLQRVQPVRLGHLSHLLSKEGTAPFLAADQGLGSTMGQEGKDVDHRQKAYLAAAQRQGLGLTAQDIFFQLKALLAGRLSPHYFSTILLDHPSLQYIRTQERSTGQQIIAPEASVLVRREGPWKEGDPLPDWYTSPKKPSYKLDSTTSAAAMNADGADGVKLLINWDKKDPVYNRYYVEEVYLPSAWETVEAQLPHIVEIVTPDPAKDDPNPVQTKVGHIVASIQGISAQPLLPDVWKLEAPGRVKTLMAHPDAVQVLLGLPAPASSQEIQAALKEFPEPVQTEAANFIEGTRAIVNALTPSGRPALLLTAGVSGAEFEVQYALVLKFGGKEVNGPFIGHLAGRGVWRPQIRLSDSNTFSPHDLGEATWEQVKDTVGSRLDAESVPYSLNRLAPITTQYARRLVIPAGLEEIPAAVEVIRPERLKDFQPELLLFDFDDTLWRGFPRVFEAQEWARWVTGQENPGREIVADIKGFLIGTAGLSWEERFDQWRKNGWALPAYTNRFMRRFQIQVRGFIEDNHLTAPQFLTPGARPLLEALEKAGIRMSVVTGGASETHRQYADELGIGRFFDRVYGGGEKVSTVAQAMNRWGVRPNEVAVIGDGVPDIKAALANGVLAVGFTTSPEHRQTLIDAGADVVIYGDFTALEKILPALNVIDAGAEESKEILQAKADLAVAKHAFAKAQEGKTDADTVAALQGNLLSAQEKLNSLLTQEREKARQAGAEEKVFPGIKRIVVLGVSEGEFNNVLAPLYDEAIRNRWFPDLAGDQKERLPVLTGSAENRPSNLKGFFGPNQPYQLVLIEQNYYRAHRVLIEEALKESSSAGAKIVLFQQRPSYTAQGVNQLLAARLVAGAEEVVEAQAAVSSAEMLKAAAEREGAKSLAEIARRQRLEAEAQLGRAIPNDPRFRLPLLPPPDSGPILVDNGGTLKGPEAGLEERVQGELVERVDRVRLTPGADLPLGRVFVQVEDAAAAEWMQILGSEPIWLSDNRARAMGDLMGQYGSNFAGESDVAFVVTATVNEDPEGWNQTFKEFRLPAVPKELVRQLKRDELAALLSHLRKLQAEGGLVRLREVTVETSEGVRELVIRYAA